MSFCPFVNDQCKGNQCMMWSNESCLVAGFFKTPSFENESIAFDTERIFEPRKSSTVPQWFKLATEKEIVEAYFEFIDKEFPETERPQYGMVDLFLQTKGVENIWNLSTDLSLKIQKIKATIQLEREKRQTARKLLRIETENMEVESLALQFLDWIDEKSMTKMYKKDVAQFLLELNHDLLWETQAKIFNTAKTRHDEKHLQRIEVEKRDLPSLIDNCMDWAKSNSFTRLTKADIDSFLIEKQLQITDETKRMLYSMTNTKLKSKR